ncbi:MAG TPA: serine/threonine-protein kinase [Kofleriaceae bacterium]|nr:serine/threonine-protein kinase [Kofleriaceae bacterium]
MTGRPPTLWDRLRGWLGGEPPPPAELPPARAPEPVHLRGEDETWLESLATELAEGRRVHEVGGDEFWARVEALWKAGHERLATEWLEKLLGAPGTPEERRPPLRARLVELYEQRGESARALVHLEVLAASAEHGLRAHYLIAEHWRRTGDDARALRHYEAVLARDVAYPNVRARVDRLRARRGEAGAAPGGETIAGPGAVAGAGGARYQLVREIGRGAVGVVYVARDLELERDVAVKLLHPHLAAASQADAVARFFAEARVCASLRHPNILAILDLDERSRRIVMELAAGGTMRQVLEERGPRHLRRALERHVQILSALAAAHARGVVHCDVKPGNLLFRRDTDLPGSEVMLGDFGVAHLPRAEGTAPRSGRREAAVGTLAYMSPEQRRGAGLDARSDLYASAVVLWEMLTGRYPWPRDILLAGTRKRGDFRLPPAVLSDAPAEIAGGLEDHLDRIGDPDPSGRPDTEQALRTALYLRDLAIAEGR